MKGLKQEWKEALHDPYWWGLVVLFVIGVLLFFL